MAIEIELDHEDEDFERPPWLGVEVTGQQQYYNSSLAQRPYCQWSASSGVAADAR